MSFRIITQSGITTPSSADLPLLAEWGVLRSDFGSLAPVSAGYWTSGKSLKLGVIPALLLRLSRELIHFNYINTKHLFTRGTHEYCHEKKSC